MFFKRSYTKEIIDDFSITDDRIDTALDELKVVNKYLGGFVVTKEGLARLFSSQKELSILDAGAGGSDILIHLTQKGFQLNITALDINKGACRYLRRENQISRIVCADVRRLPFRRSFDVVHFSLFLHHFKEDEIVHLLKSSFLICRSGIIINDLRRSVLAYAGIKILTKLLSKSSMVRNDGPLSVKKGFIKRDWIDILRTAGIYKYTIHRRWAFRWLIVIRK